jgi:hypothetical protein
MYDYIHTFFAIEVNLVATDLTFEQVNAEVENPIFSFGGGDITLSVSALTGETFAGLDDEGIVEMAAKLLAALVKAQTTANEGVVSPNVLSAFLSVTPAAPTPNGDGSFSVVQQYRVFGASTLRLDDVRGVTA